MMKSVSRCREEDAGVEDRTANLFFEFRISDIIQSGAIMMSDEEHDQEEMDEEIDEEEARKQMAEMMAGVEEMALSNLSMLTTQAWHHLGLSPIPGTSGGEVDLDQAKLAIDLFEANLKVLEGGMDDNVKKELKKTLMDLQMNYVNKKK